MERIAAEGRGILLYLRGHEGRGIGLGHKIRAYSLQDGGLDTVDANLALGQAVDSRTYAFAADLLRQWGVKSIRLMSNNPRKRQQLEEAGITVLEQVRHSVPANAENEKYLATKRVRLGHLLDLRHAVDPVDRPRKTAAATLHQPCRHRPTASRVACLQSPPAASLIVKAWTHRLRCAPYCSLAAYVLQPPPRHAAASR